MERVSTISERPFLNIIDLPPIKVTGNMRRSCEGGYFHGISKTPVKKDDPAYAEYYDAIDLNEALHDPEESIPIPPKNFTIKEPCTSKKDPVDLKLLVLSTSINKDDCCVKALMELLEKYNDQYYWKPKEALYQINSTKGAGIKCTPSNGILLPFLITHDKDIKEVENGKNELSCGYLNEPETDNIKNISTEKIRNAIDDFQVQKPWNLKLNCKCVTEEPEPDNLDSDESNMDCENDNE